MDPLRIICAIAGVVLVILTFFWSAQVLMIRGAEPPYVARGVLRGARNLLHLAGNVGRNQRRRHNIWALYVPFSLIAIVGVTLVLGTIGYALILYGITENRPRVAVNNSISSMAVLGFAGQPATMRETVVAGLEAFTAPIFVALLIGYIVNIYAQYSNQRDQVAAMDAQIRGMDNGAMLIEEAARGDGIDSLSVIWSDWADELKDIEHTYLTVDGYLLIFAPIMTKHWSTYAAIVFDAANIRNTLVAPPPDPQAVRCLDVGSVAIGQIASHYSHRTLRFRQPPATGELTQADFDDCARNLRELGVEVVDDIENAWQRFQLQRASYSDATSKLQRLQPRDLPA